LENAEVARQRHVKDVQSAQENVRELSQNNRDLERRIRQLEREMSRLTLNNEALEVELQTQRSLVQNMERRAQAEGDDEVDVDDDDPFREIAAMVEGNGKLLGDLAELRTGTHIGYNRVVTSARCRK